MFFEKRRANSLCPDERHYSSDISIEGDKTKFCLKLLIAKCTECHREKSRSGVGNTTQTEGQGNFFENLIKKSAEAGKKNRLKNKGKSLEEQWRLEQKLEVRL